MAKLGTAIIALGVYLVLCGVNLAINRPRIEKDLTERTLDALAREQMPVRRVVFRGRDGEITIRGSDAELRKRVANRATQIWGVRVAQVLSLPERAPAMRAALQNGKVTFSGELPKGAAQAKILAAAGVVFGVGNVHGDFQVSEEVGSPVYLDRLSSTLPLLVAAGEGGVLELRKLNLTLTGTVTDEDARATIEGTARELVPSELTFINQVTVVPRQTAAVPTATPTPSVKPTPVEHTDVIIPRDAFPAPPVKPKPKPRTTSSLRERRLHFFFDSVEIVPESLPRVPELVRILKEHPGQRIRIIGFADSTGPARYNVRLSKRRARAALKVLIENGLSADAFVTEGRGASEFIGDNSTPEGRALNRRVEFRVLAG